MIYGDILGVTIKCHFTVVRRRPFPAELMPCERHGQLFARLSKHTDDSQGSQFGGKCLAPKSVYKCERQKAWVTSDGGCQG